MSRLFSWSFGVCLLLTSIAGCGSDEAKPVETAVSQDDENYADDVAKEYGSPDYMKKSSN